MSQIVLDWYDARLLKHPVLPHQIDGKGWTDEGRAALLMVIFQFASSMGVFAIVVGTHLLPALVAYFWIYLIVAAVLVYSRSWVARFNVNAESHLGRALVMGTNSFTTCMGIQVLVTSMVRVYAGELKAGYTRPLWNDYLSRRLHVWFYCHLGKGLSSQILFDQDFINLLVR
eukprot:NODE_18379_length_896_cov_1.830949.p2 GENE.NODE_18379_length_896_cov_1.830949~~NODE_18379_length_896_cov_1.830949.p2  ORF type:complete len:200 (-),score=58.90 NODE_18379_length_896_cov_1.830949:297-812(-)